LEMNKKSDRAIPKIKVTLENISYMPVTASASTSTPASASASPNTSWFPYLSLFQPKTVTSTTLVLDRISTQIKPFELTAWMGPSGSGKTSLASVVANLVDIDINDDNKDGTGDKNNGTIRVNNEIGRIPKQMVGVVWQDDLLLSNLTVQETIYFAARLKMPASSTVQEVKRLVEETTKELGLLHVQHNPIRTISGGERKRVSLAQEIVVRPSLLVCDEPTSGLDATTAHSLVKTLKDLASLGHSIALVIHQPRTDIFNTLDHLLLLSKGRVVYDGNPKTVRSYLENWVRVSPLPPETGIADWIMDTIIADERKQELHDRKNNDNSSSEYVALADHWVANRSKFEEMEQQCDDGDDTSSKNRNENEPSLTHNDNDTSATTNDNNDHHQQQHVPRRFSSLAQLENTKKSAYEASFWTELSMLANRISKQQRGEKLTRVTFLLTLTYVLFTGFMYFRLPNDTANIFERNSLLFFMLIAQGNGIVTSCIAVFHRERALLRRERAKKLYRVLPYFLAKAASDSTNNILLPLIYGIVAYWVAGLRPFAPAFFRFLLGYYLTLSCAQSMGFFLSILFPNMVVAMILAPPITLFMFIMAGFYIPISNMHVAMEWVSYFSFARYGYSALLINEYRGREIPCYGDNGNDGNDNGNDGNDNDNDEFTGITIGAGTGLCPLPGEAVYESIGIDGVFAGYWFNIGIIAIFQAVFLVGSYALLRRSK